jgi:hypothetical protein
MQTSLLRRRFLTVAPFSLALPLTAHTSTPALFPMQSPELVKEMVTVSHGNVKRVRELVNGHPTLAKAAWDWGFGDWETALGAASHVGNREIANFLIEQGAPPTLFSATMLGHEDVVKALVAAQPGVERLPGPHSISLLAHAKAGGAGSEAVLKYLESLGDADRPAEVPRTQESMAALAGNYTFGDGPTDQIEIAAKSGRLMFTRSGAVGRALFCVGDREFHPAGARAVRIRFSGAGVDTVLSVHDPEPVLTARRMPPSQ